MLNVTKGGFMKKKNKERILAGLVLIGGLMVLGGVGGMQTDAVGLIGGTLICLAGFTIIFAVIWAYNRENFG